MSTNCLTTSSIQGTKVPILAGKTQSGDEVTLWCSKTALLAAIGKAMRDVGHEGVPETGAVLTVERLAEVAVEDRTSRPASVLGFVRPSVWGSRPGCRCGSRRRAGACPR